jgi:protoporphyrinogen oxidase
VIEAADIVVIGAGVSGLTFAHHLARAGRQVLVLDSAAQVGGCVHSQRQPDDFWFEMGAHTLYNSYGSLLGIVDQLGLRDRLQKRSKAPFRLLVDGRIRSISSQLRLGELFVSAWRAFSERKQGQSVAGYYGKLVGQHNYQKVFSPLFAAVPSQSVDGFPAEMLFKKRLRRKDIPRSYTFEGGLQTLMDGMARQPRMTVRTLAQVTALARTENGFSLKLGEREPLSVRQVALAIPPAQAANLLAPVAPALATALGRVRTAAIESVGVVVESAVLNLPRMMGLVPLNDCFFSVVTRDVVPHPHLRALTFHFRAGLPLDQRIERICAVTHLDRSQFKCLVTHATSLPALALGHADVTKELDQNLPGTGLYLTGNYFGGLAIEDCSLRSQQEAQRFLTSVP